MSPAADEALAKVEAERDLYLQLLTLGEHEDVDAFLRESLALIVRVTGAEHGYIELYDDTTEEAHWWAAHQLTPDAVAEVRRTVSRGIIAETLSSGRIVVTASAMLDPRFNERPSVQSKAVEAVLCAAIGGDGAFGVVYLQGRATDGLFPERDQRSARLFARHVAPFARRLVAEQRARTHSDPTLDLRRSLKLDGVVGRSAALAAVFRQVALVAPLDVTVLLTGESGTGKSLLAQVIHDNSPRAARPFVELNCGALPETLIESELFGAMPGAHSTASKRIEGKVAAAERGTLLLDEIASLTLASQAKLLQLLQSKQYYPLGSSTPLHANVRIIAATNVDLQEAVASRTFREDLYYRLHVLPLRVPSLAERADDLPELGLYLCKAACDRDGLPSLGLSRNAGRAVAAAAWPGNIRQLANVIEAAAIRAAAEGATQVERKHLFPDDVAAPGSADNEQPTFQQATLYFQRDLLRQALEDTGWNVLETARRLDMSRSHLYALLRAFELERRR